MLYVLRRKRDGLYWNNSGTRQGDKWVADLQKVTPFRSIQSARMARCFGYVPSRANWGGRRAAERDAMDAEFVRDYSVIEVRLELV